MSTETLLLALLLVFVGIFVGLVVLVLAHGRREIAARDRLIEERDSRIIELTDRMLTQEAPQGVSLSDVANLLSLHKVEAAPAPSQPGKGKIMSPRRPDDDNGKPESAAEVANRLRQSMTVPRPEAEA